MALLRYCDEPTAGHRTGYSRLLVFFLRWLLADVFDCSCCLTTVTCLGSMFHSLSAWIAKDSSYSLDAASGAVLEKGGILNLIPSIFLCFNSIVHTDVFWKTFA